MQVPFVDLQAQHAPMREELLDVIGRVIDSGSFSGGSFVDQFEREFASYCGTRHAVGVASGTDALWLAMKALGIGPGDEVITAAMGFIATVEAILMTGATPVLVDIDPVTYTLACGGLRQALSPRTRAIVPVHLFGQAADMDAILDFAAEHGLLVIEDAAQSHGAEYRGRRVGALGRAGCFSFYPGKNLGALGEGGAVVTDDDAMADAIRSLRDHGRIGRNEHGRIGWNSRMDGIQAAVLNLKLKNLDEKNELRRNIAARYRNAFQDVQDLTSPTTGENRTHVFHIFAIRYRERARLMEALERKKIGFGIHYPTPIHLQPACAPLGLTRGTYPVSEECADEFLSLPIYAELQFEQVEAVIQAVLEAAPAACVLS